MWKGKFPYINLSTMTPQEFKTLFEEYHHRLTLFAKGIIGSEFCYDVVMDTFIAVHEVIDIKAPPKQISTYLFMCVKNKCVDLIRSGAYKDRNKGFLLQYLVDELYEAQDNKIEREEMRKELREIFRLLPIQQRQVLELSIIKELNRKEIAEIMGISENTVRNHKNAAIKSIKLHIKARE